LIVDRSATGNLVVYDGVEHADELAKELRCKAKHAQMKGNPHFTTFSVVLCVKK
jgi:hypothetical protein